MNGKRIGLYLRVSTGEQTIETQCIGLVAACEVRGWRISGAKGREKCPGFDRLLKAATIERSIIQEREKAGMARARKHGTKSGKPIGQPPLSQAKVEVIRAELARGTGILKTARLCGTGVSAVQRIKRELIASEVAVEGRG